MDEAKRKRLQERLAVGCKRYANGLPAKWQEINQVWQSLLMQPSDQELLTTFHRLVHSLAGSGASFGFAEMGDIAREAEALLKSVIGGEQTFVTFQESLQCVLNRLQKSMVGV